MSILEVNNVSIRYITGDFKEIGLKEFIMRKATRNYQVKEFWADRDVSFSLEKGDMLGIIGTNGAGKSTLLKAISGIMEPTKGWVKREGTIAALLELGSGFDGELTVRENAYLRGAMLGYTRKFMDQTYADIIAFAELEEFQDRPFKQLSSGMKSRLAFSIASLVHPDILILDEVLSVGDGAFKRKSEEKMREIISGGATTILVSHSIQQVREMCNKVLWLHKGNQIAFGENVDEICDQYEAMLEGKFSLPASVLERSLPAEKETKETGTQSKNVSAQTQRQAGQQPADGTKKAKESGKGQEHNEKRNFWKKHPFAICLAVLMLTSGVSIGYVLNTAAPEIHVSELYEDISKFGFSLNAEMDGVSIESQSNKATISWDEISSYFYVSSFDGGVKQPPSSAFSDIAEIPAGTKRVQVDMSLRGAYSTDSRNLYSVIFYVATYDETGQTKIESIEPEFQNERERARNFTVDVPVNSNDKYYKILLRISPKYEKCQDGFVEISKLDVIFQR